jgi:type IV pilus assembly protein PilQ
LAFYLAIVIVLLFISSALAQTKALPRELRRASASPEEFVSMSRNMPFNQALPIFNDLSKRFISKEIIDQTPHTFPIGIDVDKMYWLDAMELILKSNDLWYREYANFMMIHPLDEAVKKETEGPIDTGRVVFETREVMISAVFFELNTTKVRESGFSWNIFSGQDTFSMTAGDNTGGLITAVVQEGYDFGSMVAVFRAMESRQIGEILASPQVTVRSKMDGSVQIGTDFSVNVQDFAGNTVTQLISTGVIMKVTPEIFTIDTLTFVNLKLDVQRSSGSTSEAGMTIAKTQAQTSVLLLDGEETIIGGLYSNKEIVLREGVPILKDLPWWIFGLRYLFGRNKTEIEQMELVILIRADLLPALNARILNRFQEIETKERMKNHLKQWKEKLGQMEEEKAKKK